MGVTRSPFVSLSGMLWIAQSLADRHTTWRDMSGISGGSRRYRVLRSRGAAVLASLHDRDAVICCFPGNPDGHRGEDRPVSKPLTAARG